MMKTINTLTHIISGLITSLTTQINPALATLLFIIFIIYELDEDWHIRDKAYRDLLEYGIGLYIGALAILIYSYLIYI